MITLVLLNFICQDFLNITQQVGSTAVFTCQHESADANIIWLVNGSSAGQFPNTTQGGSGNIGSLTITAIQAEYNGTEVMCVAFFFSFLNRPEEHTPPVTLTVIEG